MLTLAPGVFKCVNLTKYLGLFCSNGQWGKTGRIARKMLRLLRITYT